MRRRQSYFEKRPLLREEYFIRKRNFYKEKKYNSNRRLLFREEHPILKRDFY